MNQKQKTIWSDSDRARHFLIPDCEKLPPGEFILRTITGREQTVDPEAVIPFEVTHEEAKAWLKSELGGVIGKLKGGLTSALSQWTHRPEGARPPSSSEDKTEPPDNFKSSMTPPSQPGLALFSALTGESIEDLSSDPEVLRRGLNTLTRQLGSLVTALMSQNEAQLGKTQGELHSLFSTLREHGIPVRNQAEEIPFRVRKQIQSAISDEQKELGAARLEAVAQWLEETAAATASSLRKTAAQWREGQADVPSAGPQENKNAHSHGSSPHID